MVVNVVNHNEAQENSEKETANSRKVVHVGKEANEEEREHHQTKILEQFDAAPAEQSPTVEDEHEEECNDSKLPSSRPNLRGKVRVISVHFESLTSHC